MGEEVSALEQLVKNLKNYSDAVAPTQRFEDLAETFAQLVHQWQEETAISSLIAQRVMHPAYQRIIGLGPRALPLIVQELEQRPDHWFWALRAISGDDPTIPGDNFVKSRDNWLKWGRARGYIRGEI